MTQLIDTNVARSSTHTLKNRIKKYVFRIGVIVFVCLLSAELHTSGYCLTQGHRLSDTEKINHAVSYAIKENSKKVPVRDIIKNSNSANQTEYYVVYNPYKSADDFLSKNPECCIILSRDISISRSISEGFMPPSFLERVLGLNSDLVKILYPGEYKNHDDLAQQSTKAVYIAVNNCGDVTTDHNSEPATLSPKFEKYYPPYFETPAYSLKKSK